MSILVSGGGKPMGRVIGATNSKGEHPAHDELTPQDIHATIYHHLGIDYKQTYVNQAGRRSTSVTATEFRIGGSQPPGIAMKPVAGEMADNLCHVRKVHRVSLNIGSLI